MTTQLRHQSLGDISGRQGDGVIQFLGIKYASLIDRFAGSELFDHRDGQGVIDGTKLGPMVINPHGGLYHEFGFVQQSLPVPEFTTSNLEGLNLNITIPLVKDKTPASEHQLPVFVFVHGGGFALGSNAWPHYDQARIVKLSVELELPVIGVGINYRVGAPGFLTSEEMRKAGYPSNNGLRDQINAFRWIQKFIIGFGGDPKNVTFIGESAGSVAGNLLLNSKEPLFKRYISMSGTTLMLQPLPPPVSEFAYASVIKSLGAEELSSQDRIKKLLDLPPAELTTLIPPNLPLLPVIDHEIISDAVDFEQWCEELLIGDCQFDASICKFMLGGRAANIEKPFYESIAKSLGDNGKKLLKAYHINSELSDSDALYNILKFATDISFFAPSVALAKGWPGKSYMYRFNEPNSWNGEWKGEAGHVLDVAYLFQNFNEFLDQAQKNVAVRFAGDFIKFMNGKSSWPPFETKEGAQVYGPSGKGIISEYVEGVASEKSGRRNTVYELADDIRLDAQAAAWSAFFTGSE